MRETTMKKAISKSGRLLAAMALVMWLAAAAFAAAPGITGPTFNLTAQPAFLNQPDGEAVYSWGYGCNGTPAGFLPAGILDPAGNAPTCPTMQVPGPTLIVTEGQTVTVHLLNGLPAAAGNTSILFPGFSVTATGGVTGLMTQEAAPGTTVTYTFTATSPGTRAYYSGTQGDLQVEMGLYGAIIVLPTNATVLGGCATAQTNNLQAESTWGETDFRLAFAAYDHASTCYDREYLFQFSEMDPKINNAALAQVMDITTCTTSASRPTCPTTLAVPTEPY